MGEPLSAGIGLLGLEGKLYVDDDMLRIVQHGVEMEIAYADIVEVKRGTFVSWVSIKTGKRWRKLTLGSQHRKIADEMRRRAGL